MYRKLLSAILVAVTTLPSWAGYPQGDDAAPGITRSKAEIAQAEKKARSTSARKAGAPTYYGVGFYSHPGLDTAGYTPEDYAAFVIDNISEMNKAYLANRVEGFYARAAWVKPLTVPLAFDDSSINTLYNNRDQLMAENINSGVSFIHILDDAGTDDVCGVGYLGDIVSAQNYAKDGWVFGAFTRFSANCASYWRTVEHEIGHNFGMGHDRKTGGYIYDFARGYDCDGKGTIMSYTAPRHNFYSDPLIEVNGQKCGDETQANNSKLIRDFGETYARMNGVLNLPFVSLVEKQGVSIKEGMSAEFTLRRESAASEAYVAVSIDRGTVPAQNIDLFSTKYHLMASHRSINKYEVSTAFKLIKFEKGQLEQKLIIPTYSDSDNRSAGTATLKIVGAVGLNYIENDSVGIAISEYDLTPNAFSFEPKLNQPTSVEVTSSTVTITGVDDGLEVIANNGGVSQFCNGQFYPKIVINSGDSICVKLRTSNQEGAQTSASITVGTFSTNFITTTKITEDTQPDDMAFAPATGADLDKAITSNSITITGINTAADISVSNGEFSIGCNSRFQKTPTKIEPGASVCVRSQSSNLNSRTVTAKLFVGQGEATFSVTTKAASTTTNNTATNNTTTTTESSSSSGGGGSLAIEAFALLLLAGRRQKKYFN